MFKYICLSIFEMILLVLGVVPFVSPLTLPHYGLQVLTEFTFSESCLHRVLCVQGCRNVLC